MGPIPQRVYEFIIEMLWKLFRSNFKLMIKSGHNFAHAMTAELSWHVQNSDLIIQLFFIQEQHAFYKISIMSS